VETVAVYWEDRIKTYGFSEVAGLALIQWSASPESLSRLGSCIQDTREPDMRMLLVLGQGLAGGPIEFGLLVERQWEDETIRIIRGFLGDAAANNVTSYYPACLIQFYGPHFGDRYGIAAAALNTLMERKVPILGIACSASSIYLVLTEARMAEAREALSKAFLPPTGQCSKEVS
jgi:hypothetical protein